ncbi:MAG: Crp/Fnr family transcriptional regulator [Clostridia bacterium]|nr:Crp/Fnr family transcriptional regulator [Clostridia bacterium]
MNELHDTEALLSSPVFSGCTAADAAEYAESFGVVESLPRGGLISLGREMPRFGIILSGSVMIYAESSADKPALLRIAARTDPIGIAGLYSDIPIETKCVAGKEGCSICFFTRDSFEKITSSPAGEPVRMGFIRFLSKRVAFLNSRIGCLTGGTADRRLACFILSHTDSDGCYTAALSMSSLSHALDVGRASLYRALEKLERLGAISYENNTITVTDAAVLSKLCSG